MKSIVEEPSGWKLVPVEPTPEMQAAFYRDNGEPQLKPEWFAVAYKDMLAAAPPSPQPHTSEEK